MSNQQRQIMIYRTPYSNFMDNNTFKEIIRQIITDRAEALARLHASGEYSRPSMGYAILDPTAPADIPTSQTLMVLAEVGPEGERFGINARAKAFEHRNLNANCGVGVFVSQHRLQQGAFRFGFSADVDGTIVGASGASSIQDRREATILGADFNYRVQQFIEKWKNAKENKEGWWMNNDNIPDRRYTEEIPDPLFTL